VEAAAKSKLDQTLAALRQRRAEAERKGQAAASLQTAQSLVARRAQEPVRADEGFLCWNEAYFQHALIDLWELTGERRWLEMAIRRMVAVWAVRADRRGIQDSFWGRTLPTWYNDSETGTACTLTSGAILNPIARLMRVVHGDPKLADLNERVRGWGALCQEVVALHDPEWVEFADGCGMHLEPYPKGPRRIYPRGGSRVNPLNRQFALGMPMLNLARVLGDAEYLRKVNLMARFFRQSSEITADRFVWEYSASPYPAEGEDIDHAHCQVHFAELCCREGVVISEDDLRKIAGTLEKNIFRHSDVPCGTLRGCRPGLHVGLGTWSSLCRFAPQLLPRIVAVIETAMREGSRLFAGEGWGIRILTCIEKARRGLPLWG
jgi:hypothetical protein